MIDSVLEVKPIANKPTAEPQALYTTGEVAARTGLSQQTIIRCFDSGRIGGFRVPGSSSRRITHEALITFMRSHGIPMVGESDSGFKIHSRFYQPVTIGRIKEDSSRPNNVQYLQGLNFP